MANFNESIINDFFKKEREYKNFSDDTKKKINTYYKKVSKPSEPEWHDIEADPTDLPPYKTEVLVEGKSFNGAIYHKVAYIVELKNDYCWVSNGEMYPLDEFHAWKYITPYKNSKGE